MKAGPTDLQRAEMRHRPEGRPVMNQSWGKLLFIHWRVKEELLRPLIPKGLEIDTFDGSAWIGVVPFTIWGMRAFPPFLPPVPGFSSMHELNVRTYVYVDDIPGVWFFTLDCTSAAATMAARSLYFLNYLNAEIELEQSGDTIDYFLEREDDPPATFKATWQIGETLKYSQPGSLEFFLTERYALFSERDGELYLARIHHPPWPLQKATLSSFESTMIESLGLPTPEGTALLHYAEELNVDIWPLEEVPGD